MMVEIANDLLAAGDRFAQRQLQCVEEVPGTTSIAHLKLHLCDALVLNMNPASKIVDLLIDLQEQAC